MGGRGASSGTSALGNKYGTQYKTLLKSGNIKFVTKNARISETLMETMTKGRVYVHAEGRELKSIVYFDKANKRTKQIDLKRPHDRVLPHTHHGYNHFEHDSAKEYAKLTTEERRMVENVRRIWDNRDRKV